MIQERSFVSRVFDVLNYAFLAILAISCILPMVHVFAVSLSSRGPAEASLVGLWPIQFTIANYQRVLKQAQVQRSTIISIVRTVLGTTINMLLTALTAYPLALDEGFWGKRLVKWLLMFGMLFSGGLIPVFLMVRSLRLLDTIWALVLPGALPIWNVIVLLNFYRGLPKELSEAASIDGASHWRILFRIYLPLSLPALATLTLFCAVGHWNSWFDGLIYMMNIENVPLQTYLRSFLSEDTFRRIMGADPLEFDRVSFRSLRAAQVAFATVPILMMYPFLQRYFVQGLTLGSVKG